jgi:hypothetical protein
MDRTPERLSKEGAERRLIAACCLSLPQDRSCPLSLSVERALQLISKQEKAGYAPFENTQRVDACLATIIRARGQLTQPDEERGGRALRARQTPKEKKEETETTTIRRVTFFREATRAAILIVAGGSCS